MVRYVALGSTASSPTRERSCPSGLLITDSEKALIDCGEGTSRQLLALGQPLSGISFVWLSHSHLDHYLGIAGFFWNLDLLTQDNSITIFGDSATIKGVDTLRGLLKLRSLNMRTKLVEGGVFHETEQYRWRAFPLRHTVPSFGLVVEEKASNKMNSRRADELGVPNGPERGNLVAGEEISLNDGRKVRPSDVMEPMLTEHRFVYIADTTMFDGLVEECRNADLLVCEATYSSEDSALAKKYGHMTVEQASGLAHSANAHKLILNHISPRYDLKMLERSANAVFSGAIIANDLTEYDMPLHKNNEEERRNLR
jgi:ribonuclease Z